MLYYEKEYYIEAKKRLREEYKVGFKKAENYIRGSFYGLEHEENCLMQILDDFLSAQNDSKSLSRITGSDLRKYCDYVIKAEADRLLNRKLFLIELLSVIPFSLMLIIFFRSFLFNNEAFTVYNFNHLQIKGFDLIYIAMFVFIYVLRSITSKVFFNNYKLARLCNVVLVIIMIGAASILIEGLKLDNLHAIPVSFPVFITILILSAAVCITCIVIGKKNRVKTSKSVDLEMEANDEMEETLQPEQVICPDCGKEHDYDYPRCPYCRHKYFM